MQLDLGTFISFFRTEFEKELSRKTGWGRLEILSLVEVCIQRALMKIVETA